MRRLVFTAAALLGASACTDDSTPASDAPPAPADAPVVEPDVTFPDAPPMDAPDLDAPPVDAAGLDAPPGDAAAPDAPPPAANQGLVAVAERTYYAGGMDSTDVVTMNLGPIYGGPIAAADACALHPLPGEASLSAGDISITGTTLPITLFPVGSGPLYDYQPALMPDDLFAPGASISFSAPGGAIWPAFSGSVIAPDPLSGTVVPTTLSHAVPATLTWDAGSGDETWIWLITVDSSMISDANLLWCRAPDSGSFTFSDPAWALIPATHDAAFMIVWRTNQTEVVPVPDYAVLLTVASIFQSDFVMLGP
jgi:hypothetical protein